MYNDETIKIDFSIPEYLLEVVKALDKSMKEDSQAAKFRFLTELENLEVYSKGALLDRQITEQQLDLLWRKYGLR